MAVTEAKGDALATFSNFSFTFFGLIFDTGLQNQLYKSRLFAVSEDPRWILNGTLLTLMSARTPSVRQVDWSVGGWIPKGYGPADDPIIK